LSTFSKEKFEIVIRRKKNRDKEWDASEHDLFL